MFSFTMYELVKKENTVKSNKTCKNENTYWWGYSSASPILCQCFVYVCVHPVSEVSWGGAVRVQDARYVADDVSKLSLWTATLS